MKVRVVITTTVTDGMGKLLTEVTSAEESNIGDNPRFVRSEIIAKDLYGKAESLNLDQVIAGFRA